MKKACQIQILSAMLFELLVAPASPAAEGTPPAVPAAPTNVVVETVSLPGGVALEMIRIPGTNFWMGKFEVTQPQWEAVMGSNPSQFKDPLNPVEHVNCEDCETFCAKLNELPEVKAAGFVFRLPTSQEWEFACRGGSKKRFMRLADGREIVRDTLSEVAWYGETSAGVPGGVHHVGDLAPNAFGLYDVLGNLWEWTSTPSGEKRVNRGGSLNDNGWVCQAHFKNETLPHSRRTNNGLRLCADRAIDSEIKP